MKEDKFFLKHILESILAIEDFSKGLSKSDLTLSRLKQSAIIRELEIIGEASKNLSEKFKDTNFNIPWKEIIGSRDKLIHHYFGVDIEIIWNVIKKDLPILKKNIGELLNE